MSQTSIVRQLNDELRQFGRGGQIVVTAGIATLDPTSIQAVLRAVREFSDFTPDNDPYDEHDCASLAVQQQRIIWKIDYYDLAMSGLSPNPSNAAVTRRVLTIMLADEH